MVSSFTRKLYLIVLLQLLAINILVKAETLTAVSYNGGTGTEADPFQINTLAQLRLLSESPDDWDAYFIQTADIDASDTQTWNVGDHDNDVTTADEAMGFSPIGDRSLVPARQGVSFNGNYNGNGFLISGLYINRPKENFVGLFGYVLGNNYREIQNIALKNANILGQSYVGTIAGVCAYTTVKNCYATGIITGGRLTGGMAGSLGYASNCYVDVQIICDDIYQVGIAYPYFTSTNIKSCYYNKDTYTQLNSDGAGIGLSAQEMGVLSFYTNWNIITDPSLIQGAAPVLDNNGDSPIWKINPAFTYSVTFIVKDINNVPISGAMVQCNGEILTDENGEAEVSFIPNTSSSYIIVSNGMKREKGDVSVESANVVKEVVLYNAYDGGNGTEDDPFRIATLEQLRNLSENTQDWKSFFIQTDNIDATDTRTWNIGDHDDDESTEDVPMGFSPIGDGIAINSRQGVSFSGNYNGNGYFVSNLYINRPEERYVGFFGEIDNSNASQIKYLAIVDANIKGFYYVGVLAGYSYANISNCYTSGLVKGSGSVGGFVGKFSNVNNCYAQTEVICGSSSKGGIGVPIYDPSGVNSCFYNKDIYKDSNYNGFGKGLSEKEMGALVYYNNWNVLIDASLKQGDAPILSNNGDAPVWRMNPALTHNITFIVRDKENNPIEGARIECINELVTNENGEAQIELLPNSTNLYSISAYGKSDLEGEINIESSNIVMEIKMEDAYDGGDGSEVNPFKIANLTQLRSLSENTQDWNAFFIQTADIDASDTQNWNVGDHDNNDATFDVAMGFSPIGRSSNPFNGSYNGNGYSITNLYINRVNGNFIGLFGYVDGNSSKYIKQLAVLNAEINGDYAVGVIAGLIRSTSINNCYTSGIISGGGYSGGLVGSCKYANNCYASTKVISSSANKGGLGCEGYYGTSINNCYYNSDIYTDSNENGYGTGLSNEEMRDQSSFDTWDFVDESTNGDEDIWAICSEYNNGYPYFARGRITPEISFTSFSVEYNGSSRTINDSPYFTMLPFSNVSNEPSQTLKAASAIGDLKVFYRLANQETEQEWSSVGPVNADVYDVKLYVEPYSAFLANVLIVEGGMTITKADAVIAFGALEDKSYGDESFELTGTVTGDATIAYASSNTDVATVSGNIVSIVGIGSTTITASAAATSNVNAATDVTQNLTVNKADAVITFNALEEKTYGDESFELTGSVTGDATIVYASSNTDVATVSGNIVSIVGVGSTTITASAAATSNVNAATDVTQNLTVNKADAVITFNALEEKTYGDESFELTGSVTGDASLTYASSNTDVATVSGNVVTIVGAGSTTITASAIETTNYNEANNVEQGLTVSKAAGNITWSIAGSTIAKAANEESFMLEEAITNTGTSIKYTSDNPSVATVYLTTGEVSLVSVGTAIITATANETNNYNQASTTVTIEVSTPTSVGENKESSFVIYPNPASKEVRIDGVDNNTIEVYSITGSKVLSVHNTSIIDVSNLPKGAYIVKVGTYMKRLIVK